MLGLRRHKILGYGLTVIGSLAVLQSGCEEPVSPAPKREEDPDPAEGSDEDDAGKATVDASTRRDAGKPVTPPKSDAGTAKVDAGTDAYPAKDAGRSDSGTVSTPPKDGGTAVLPATGCAGDAPEVPDDPLLRGPWETGVRTAKIGRLTVEVFYPAKEGSAEGKPVATYDARQFLPAAERSKITDAHSHIVSPVGGHLYRDLPIDDTSAPYPVVVFIHGTASHRASSVTTHTHWASRGFVVLSADYPGLGLGDQMASTLECLLPTTGDQDIPGDVNLQLAGLKSVSGDLAFLKDRIDPTRLAVSGHSQGGCLTATLSALPNVKLVMPLSGSTTVGQSSSLESILFVSGVADTVIGYDSPLIGNTVCPLGSSDSVDAYVASPGPPKVKKRIVGITGGGHLSVTDLCDRNKAGKSSIEELQAAGVCGVGSAVIIGLPALFDCGTIDWKKGVEAVNYATTAALEETLYCRDRTSQFAALKSKVPEVGDFRETVK
ncbi:MAG: hypothetical protein RLZZ450_4044 [Pseudomonadota bacterium]|jgi:hypothetical protein